MYYERISSLSPSLFEPPPPKRRKLDDKVEESRKRSFEANENGPPCKRRKIESEVSYPRHPLSDRFIPRREEAFGSFPYDSMTHTPYQKSLAATLFGSINPADERILHFFKRPRTSKHPLPPSSEALFHPKCCVSKIHAADELLDDYYAQALTYNRPQDCLAIILDGQVILTRENQTHELALPEGGIAKSIAFNLNGNALSVGLEDGRLVGYDVKYGAEDIRSRIACEIDLYSPCNQIVFSDSSIFTGLAAGKITRINTSNISELGEYVNPNASPITGLVLSRDGRYLLAADNEGTLHLFHPDGSGPLHTLKAFHSAVKALAFSPCGRFFAAGGGNGDPRIALFSVQNGRIEEIESRYTGSQATALFWHKDFLFSTHRDGFVRTCPITLNSRSLLGPPELHEIPVRGNRLSYAALKCQDTLVVGCGATGQIFEIDLRMFQKPREAPPFSRYSTIR